jgi:hypothetical protein
MVFLTMGSGGLNQFSAGILPNFATRCYPLTPLSEHSKASGFSVENAAFCREKSLYIKMHNEKPSWRSGLYGVRICPVTPIFIIAPLWTG